MPQRLTARGKDTKEMTIWGVGPKIMIPGYAILIVLSRIPVKIGISELTAVPGLYISAVASVLIAVGIVLLALGNSHIKEALKAKKLTTKGVFSYVRNPMYAAHIFFIMPGICFLTNNATTLCSVICTLIIFYFLISNEEKELEKNFGIEYAQYKNRVGRLLPKFGLNKKRQ